MQVDMTHLAEAGANPLLPNATFFVELIIFLIVLLVLWRFILPPIQKVLRDRHDMVQRTIEESRNAEVRFKEAEARYHEALAEARSEAGRIRDRSEEHTSELQSQSNLVCRLLLEK